MPRKIEGPLLLDTHVWIWAVEDVPGRLSPSILRAIDRAASDGELYVSAISVWEIGTLLGKGRLAFSMEFDDWLKATRRPPGALVEPVTPEIALDSTALPNFFHGDPADRIIVATARALNAGLVTRDRRILKYGEEGHLLTYDPAP